MLVEYYRLRPEAVDTWRTQRCFHGQSRALLRLYMAVSAPGGVHAAVSSSIQFMVFTRNIFSNSVNRKKNPLMVPGWKKAQILHFSAGVTLRLYSGNRVWNEVYSHKRSVFWNQIMRRYYRAFLILFSEPSSRLSKKQPTNEEARAPARTVNSDGENLILPPDIIFTIWGLMTGNELI